jgi:hypothetical protein
MKKYFILLFSITFFSCQNNSENKSLQTDSTGIMKTNTDLNSADSTIQHSKEPIRPPDMEEAETLVARYYSTRNQELQYPFYKGIGLKILEIKNIPGTDSFFVFARVSGRKWPNPNKDTLTFPFEENKRIRAFKNGPLWQADSVGKK